MLERAKQVFKKVNEKMSLGAGNVYKVPESKNSLLKRDKIADYYHYLYLSLMTPLKDIDPSEFNLYMTFLLALFGEIYKTGKCGEYGFLSTVLFLEQNQEKNLGIVCIDDKSKDTNHALLFINFPETLDLDAKDTYSYADFLLFDTWPGNAKIKKYNGKTKFSMNDLKNSETPTVDKISFYVKFPGNLPLVDWLKVGSFFSMQKTKLDKNDIRTAIRNSEVQDMNPEVEFKKLNYHFFTAAQKYGSISEKYRGLAKFPSAAQTLEEEDSSDFKPVKK